MAFKFLGLILTLWACAAPPGREAEKEKDKESNYVSDQQIVSFVYHRFGDARFPSTNISLEVFEAHLRFLKENKFTVLSLGEALDQMDAPGDTVPRIVVITVDDGYRSFKENGWPLLKKYGFPATLFINTESVGQADYLTWEDLRQLRKEGVEIGNHSHSHAHFVNFAGDELKALLEREIAISQGLFKKRLNFLPDLFAYPYGENNRLIRNFLKNSGFRAAAAQNSGVISSRADRFALPRFPMASGFASLESFKRKVGMNALPLLVENAQDHLIHQNPPMLSVRLANTGDINLNQAQFFVQGRNLTDHLKLKKNNGEKLIELTAPEALAGRRTLYTVTAPSTDGREWYWYSYLWINPSVGE